MNEKFCITDFGAEPNGKTDCTQAIQSALDKAGEVKGRVTVPGGTYLCGELKIPSGVTVEGNWGWNWSHSHGFEGSVLEFTGDGKCLMNMTDASYSTIAGVSLNGMHRGENAVGVLTSRGGENIGITVENSRIGHFSGDSVRLEGVSGFYVRHSMLCFSEGFSLYADGTDGSITDNWLSGSKRDGGIAFGAGTSKIRVVGNRCEDTDGVDMTLFTGNPDLQGENDLTAEGKKILCRDITIAGNCFCGGYTGGLRATAPDGYVILGLTFTGNVFDSNGNNDIEKNADTQCHLAFENCEALSVTGNVFFTKKGFWEPDKPFNTKYCIVYGKLKNAVIAGNAINIGASTAEFLDRGGSEGAMIIRANAGRKAPPVEGLMFPYWGLKEFPDAAEYD